MGSRDHLPACLPHEFLNELGSRGGISLSVFASASAPASRVVHCVSSLILSLLILSNPMIPPQTSSQSPLTPVNTAQAHATPAGPTDNQSDQLPHIVPAVPETDFAMLRIALRTARLHVIGEKLKDMPAHVVAEAREMLLDPDLFDRIAEDLVTIGIVGEQRLAMTTYLVATSRMLSQPLSQLIQGLSSAGKSHVINKAGSLFPPESVLHATDLTPNALYYMSPGALIHTVVLGGERSRLENNARAESTRALREMISEGQIQKVVTQRGPSGELETQRIWQPGPIAFIESTTLGKIFDEDANRMLLLSTDESSAQTKRVIQAQAAAAARPPLDVSEIILRHHALQRLLEPCHVLVPFAEALYVTLPTSRPEARRVMSHILRLIATVTLLRQYQRCTGSVQRDCTLIATVDDYTIARELLVGPIARLLMGGISQAALNLGKHLHAHFGTKTFTSTEAAASNQQVTSRKVCTYLNDLADIGVAKVVNASRGNKAALWQMTGPVPERGEQWLPSVRAVRQWQAAHPVSACVGAAAA